MSEKSSNFVTSLKTVSVLLVICIVCGALLALCNDLFYIDEATKFNRAMQKVYPQFDRDTSVSETPIAEFKDLAGVGKVSKVYLSKDGTYILEATGYQGWDGGNVTMYIAIGGKNPDVQIKSLVVTGNVAQSYMSKVDQKSINKTYVGKNIKDIAAVQYGPNYQLGGTTYTSTAILNCVKAAINYCVTALKLVSTPESEARDAALLLLEGYTLTTVTDEAYTTELGVNFYFTGTKDGADNVDVYVFGDTESGHQIVAVKAGLKHADRIQDTAIVAKSEGIDNALVTKVQGLSQLENQVRNSVATFTYDADGDLSQYTTNDEYAGAQITSVYMSNEGTLAVVAQAPGFGDGPLVVMVIIDDGKIAGWELVNAGGNSFFDNYLTDTKLYVGSSINNPFVFNKDDATVNVTGATVSGEALNKIINLATYYARSIMQ